VSGCALTASPLQSALCWRGNNNAQTNVAAETHSPPDHLGFVLLMAVSLIVFYGPGRNSSTIEPPKNNAVVAKVGREEITVASVAQLKDNYMQMFARRISMAQLGGYKRFVDG